MAAGLVLGALDQAGGEQLVDREAGDLPTLEDRVPGARREADAEAAQGLLAEAALADQVVARLAGLPGLPEVVLVEAGGTLERVAQPAAPAARLLGLRILGVALDLDAVALGERLDRIGERESLLLLDEADRVAPRLAAEAVVEALRRLDRERGRALVVEGAEADEALTLAAQVGVGGNDLDDVGGLTNALERLGGETPRLLKNAVRAERAPPGRRKTPAKAAGRSEPGHLRQREAAERRDAEPVRHPGHVIGHPLQRIVAGEPR
jgi:hypothetical protein